MSSHFHQEFPSLQAAGEVKDGQEEEPYGPGPSLRPQSMDTATTGERGGLHSRLQFSLVIQNLKKKKKTTLFEIFWGVFLFVWCFLVLVFCTT